SDYDSPSTPSSVHVKSPGSRSSTRAGPAATSPERPRPRSPRAPGRSPPSGRMRVLASCLDIVSHYGVVRGVDRAGDAHGEACRASWKSERAKRQRESVGTETSGDRADTASALLNLDYS